MRASAISLTASNPIAPIWIAWVTAAVTTSERQRLQQSQHLDELALAPVAHPGLEQVAQVLEHVRQVPALQRRCLVERVRLGLDQRQIVERIGDERALAIAALMPGDLLPPHRITTSSTKPFTTTSWKP